MQAPHSRHEIKHWSWTTAEGAPTSGPIAGNTGINTTNGNEYIYNGSSWIQVGTGGAAHVYGAIRNWVKRIPGDGAYTATDVLGIWVAAVPTADDTAITPIGGTADTAVVKELFIVGDILPIHATSVTVGTGGIFYLIIPDA